MNCMYCHGPLTSDGSYIETAVISGEGERSAQNVLCSINCLELWATRLCVTTFAEESGFSVLIVKKDNAGRWEWHKFIDRKPFDEWWEKQGE